VGGGGVVAKIRGTCLHVCECDEEKLLEEMRYFDVYSTVAVNKPASMSSAFNPAYHRASNAVDDNTTCSDGFTNAHTAKEFNPWIQIDMQNTVDIAKVLVYNRQDQSGILSCLKEFFFH
jgi:hypothetical protein